jgi:AcrR family transcriptional regulator
VSVRAEQRAQRLEKILDALSEALKHKPLAQVSVEELAEASGIARQRFYKYFPTKYSALGALIDRTSDALMDVYFQPGSWFLRPDNVPPRTALLQSFRGVVEMWRTHGQIFREVADLWNMPDAARTHWYRFMDRMVEAAALQIQRERNSGLAPLGPDPYLLAKALLWMGERLLFLDAAETAAGIAFGPAELEAMADLWLRAIYETTDPALP